MGLRGRKNLSEETIFFVTTTVVNFENVFSNSACCELLINNIIHYQKKYAFNVLGYVIMPSHFHWIVQTNPSKGTISDIMRDIKKYSAWDILEQLSKENNIQLLRIFEKEAENYHDRKRKFWMKRFDDKVIKTPEIFRTKLNYIHNNPVKAGLVVKPEEYIYSSARNYLKDDNSILFVDTTIL